VGPALPKPPGQLQAVHHRHPDVGDHEVELARGPEGHAERLVAVPGGADFEPGIPEQALEHGPDDRIVLGDEDALRDRGGIVCEAGSRLRAPGLAGVG